MAKILQNCKISHKAAIYLTWLIWVLSQIMLMGKNKKVERIGMEGLKPPYILLSNHLSFVDFELVALGTYPQRMNNVVNVDGYYLRPWLMEWIGSISTRKFTSDIHLVKSIHKVLYQCPHCMTESKVASEGTEIFCRECGKRWNLNEDGTLSAVEGETEFSHVPDWFEWEREQVKVQIERGEYSFEDDVEIYSQPGCYSFPYLGKGTLVHNPEVGFVVRGNYNGEDFCIHREPIQTSGLHVEYDFGKIKPHRDCLDVSTENDSFYCYPTKENVITKIAFATEIIYQNCEKNTVKKRRAAARAAE